MKKQLNNKTYSSFRVWSVWLCSDDDDEWPQKYQNEVKSEKLKFVKICDEFLVQNVCVGEFC